MMQGIIQQRADGRAEWEMKGRGRNPVRGRGAVPCGREIYRRMGLDGVGMHGVLGRMARMYAVCQGGQSHA